MQAAVAAGQLDADHIKFVDPNIVATNYDLIGQGKYTAAVLQTRIDGGNPPDVVSNPSIGQMRALIEEGRPLRLDDVLDVATLRAQYDEGLLALGSDDGGSR